MCQPSISVRARVCLESEIELDRGSESDCCVAVSRLLGSGLPVTGQR